MPWTLGWLFLHTVEAIIWCRRSNDKPFGLGNGLEKENLTHWKFLPSLSRLSGNRKRTAISLDGDKNMPISSFKADYSRVPFVDIHFYFAWKRETMFKWASPLQLTADKRFMWDSAILSGIMIYWRFTWSSSLNIESIKVTFPIVMLNGARIGFKFHRSWPAEWMGKFQFNSWRD